MTAYLDWIRETINTNIPNDYYEAETSTPENYEAYARDIPLDYEPTTDDPYDYLSKHYCEAFLNLVRRRRRMCKNLRGRSGGRRQSRAKLNRKQLETGL